MTGESIYAICSDWTSRGIYTITGVSRWTNDKLKYILTSVRMIGKREYEGMYVDLIDVPAILPGELWRQVCEKLATRKDKRGRREARQLSNIALCGICHSTLIGDVETDTGTLIYVCKKRPAVPTACGGINVRVAGTDASVNEKIVAFLNDGLRVAAAA